MSPSPNAGDPGRWSWETGVRLCYHGEAGTEQPTHGGDMSVANIIGIALQSAPGKGMIAVAAAGGGTFVIAIVGPTVAVLTAVGIVTVGVAGGVAYAVTRRRDARAQASWGPIHDWLEVEESNGRHVATSTAAVSDTYNSTLNWRP